MIQTHFNYNPMQAIPHIGARLKSLLVYGKIPPSLLDSDERPCVVCGLPFRKNRLQVTCGPECRSIHYRNTIDAAKRKSRALLKIKKRKDFLLAFRCHYCGNPWPDGKSALKTSWKYCSKTCKQRAQTQKIQIRKQSDPVYASNRRARIRAWDNRTRAHQTELKKSQRHRNPQVRLARRLRNRLREVLLRGGHDKTGSALNLLGCTLPEFRSHLEAQFTPSMTWYNYGARWEIDHIHPCASFDLSDVRQVALCFHYTNLRPMMKWANRRKSDTITDPQFSLQLAP